MSGRTPVIARLERRHIRACEGIVACSEPWVRLGERIDFSEYIGRRCGAVRAVVCTTEGEVAGFALFAPDAVFARGGYLKAIGVTPAFLRRGIGTLLLDHVERETAARAANIYLCVSSFNRRAQAFYRNRGYVRTGTLPGLLVPGASEHLYWKRLPPTRKGSRR